MNSTAEITTKKLFPINWYYYYYYYYREHSSEYKYKFLCFVVFFAPSDKNLRGRTNWKGAGPTKGQKY